MKKHFGQKHGPCKHANDSTWPRWHKHERTQCLLLLELVNVSPSGDNIDKHAVCGIKCTTVPSAQKEEKRSRGGEKR